jgi:hypothetical protein
MEAFHHRKVFASLYKILCSNFVAVVNKKRASTIVYYRECPPGTAIQEVVYGLRLSGAGDRSSSPTRPLLMRRFRLE